MTALERVAGLWFAVLDASALAAATLTARYSTSRRVSAVVTDQQDFVLYQDGGTAGPPLGRILPDEAGATPQLARLLRRSHVTLELDPRSFVFKAIELPARATDFIEAIVRNQIDRLTPWRPEQVVFGWGPAAPTGTADAISVTVAATDKDAVLPLVDRVQRLGAAVVVARVPLPAGIAAAAPGAVPTVIVARFSAAAFAVAFWRRLLGIATAIVVVLVIGSSLFDQIASMHFASVADELDRDGKAKRARIETAANDRDPAAVERRLVEQHRGEVPYATLVLEAVSRILPDNSFVTGFEITGTRLRLVGFTADAAALIPLLEASKLFTKTGFFAPTTRLPEDPGDRFNVEATVRPGAFLP